jgi:hypothetical protein
MPNYSIFISYRRKDSIDITERMCDRLRDKFQIFKDKDKDAIRGGVDWKRTLREVLSNSKVLLAVIGKDWLTVAEPDGTRRLDNPEDSLRLELESAFSCGIPVIPVLVAGASMPSKEELPESIKDLLVYQQSIEVRRDPDFHSDMDRLIDDINWWISYRQTPEALIKKEVIWTIGWLTIPVREILKFQAVKFISEIELKTKKGNYVHLRDLLADKKWKETDEETMSRMLQVIGKNEWKAVNSEDIERFPCEDLRIIDKLWRKYSNNHFGFSVQKEILPSHSDTVNYEAEKTLGNWVGWRRREEWLERSQLTFDLANAPRGHLPCCTGYLANGFAWNSGLCLASSLASRAKACNLLSS